MSPLIKGALMKFILLISTVLFSSCALVHDLSSHTDPETVQPQAQAPSYQKYVEQDNSQVNRSIASSKITPMTKRFYMMMDECSIVGVEMNTGKLNTMKSESFTVACVPSGRAQSECSFFDVKNKPFANTKMLSVIDGAEAVIASDGNADLFVVNLIGRKIMSLTRVNFDHGRVRGSKTCSGHLFYDEDIDSMKSGK